MKLEEKPSNFKREKIKKPTRTIKELEDMLEFVNSQIAKLHESGSQDKRLFNYLNTKKDEAEQEIARQRGKSK